MPETTLPPIVRLSRRQSLLLGSSALAGAALPGCASAQKVLREVIQEPTARITGFAVREMQLDRIGTTFEVAIDNPNPIGFTLAGIEYDVAVEGTPFASGASQDEVQLTPQGTSRSSFDVDFSLLQLAEPLIEVLRKDVLGYRIDARFLVGLRERGTVGLPATFAGELPVPEPPRTALVSVAFPEMSLAGLDTEVILDIANPNAFDLPLTGMKLSFSVNGRPILQQRPLDGLTLTGNAHTEVPVQFLASFLDMGLSVAQVIATNLLSWKVDLEVTSGEAAFPFSFEGSTRILQPPPGS